MDNEVTETKTFIEKVESHLIADWRTAYKYLSVQLSALGILIMGLAETLGSSWGSLPPELRDRIPDASTIALTIFGLTIVGRLLKTRNKGNGGTDC